MKDFIIIWVTVQLVVIGVVGTTIMNDLQNNTFECSTEIVKIPMWKGVVFPLAFFVSDLVGDYCNDKQN